MKTYNALILCINDITKPRKLKEYQLQALNKAEANTAVHEEAKIKYPQFKIMIETRVIEG